MSPSPLDLLRDLQDRVAALEKQAGDTPGVDTLQPNVLTVAEDGTIGADFTGHVHAQGLDLDEASGLAFTPASAVDWKDSAGSIREFLQGAFNLPTLLHQLVAQVNAVGGLGPVQLVMNVDGSRNLASMFANAGLAGVTVIQSDGASGFLQLLGSTANAHVTWGIFPSFATAPANSSNDYAATAAQFGFSSAIIASVMGAIPQTTWSGFRVSNGINNNGDIHIENGATAQVFDVPFVAIGH